MGDFSFAFSYSRDEPGPFLGKQVGRNGWRELGRKQKELEVEMTKSAAKK